MRLPNPSEGLANTLYQRRQKLAQLVDFPVLLWSGGVRSRNFPANIYPFRASSHFLYFAGLSLVDTVIHLEGGKLTLFMDDPDPGSALWHGDSPSRDRLAEIIGANSAFPKSELTLKTQNAATVRVQDLATIGEMERILKRPVIAPVAATGQDLALIKAIINLRLCHDPAALSELKKAAAVTVKAHQAGILATPTASQESDIRAAMEAVIIAHNMTCSYNSIVTTEGQVLHNELYHNPLKSGDLLLADVGAETPGGWAGDVTRTWPVSGTFSPTQADIYDVVLAAHDACIEQVKPGVEYRDIHLLATAVITEGLVDLGILRGQVTELVEKDAHALFFPHGIGHLLGLDVHDMEDLGDLAGYAPGRKRSDRFGLGFLRLNRPLAPGMLVTIEPGFYQVPAILNNPKNRQTYRDIVNWEQLEKFADVRGIRIEDDVLVTDSGWEVLTAALPSQRHQITK
ncbi:aminopeptidase P family protein [Arthrospira platensis]|jgi:Xaa-Pro aminopeptidase/Xaa-Pro dipeptidase|uniref:Xaa-Pro aminopeptidase n=1 Tax=Limnospira platensis NIES-46 TaxID=1236695 RepID=A0A5M3T5T7_LIMPL|nr:aminopeptidase P family protein [Arthrospira platensis]KDR58471.1 aminopeptidase [Arthrospira platensis str. Paraca]MBD2670075.1 aminopeptidase P family protein [Arthrospira platensis FACHB-439]MBD2710572.1 aminopeptidase P family protein [Arthrospira platensis FACHB-835]MDF2211060.1 aminopeptidase P family protein [Arthrospira platensis NCB002]MDT9182646.1 aminopeptidase P family protein [Limnospira sp. PMC 289.06]MDT9310308.1 aminopeptidase P family protein [Limnospira sp. Paracas R14]Q